MPDLSTVSAGPLYQRLADSIEAEIDAGSMAAGSKLPPQRDLAFDLRTTVGTVGRAYSLLRERGLVSGEVGRGTYVLARQAAAQLVPANDATSRVDGTRLLDAPLDKIRFDSTGAPDVGQGAAITEIMIDIGREFPDRVSNYSRVFPDSWFDAGSRWLSRNGFQPGPDAIVPTLGVHAAAMAAISALTAPGDQIVFEHLTYAQIARSAALIGRRAALVQSDDGGMDPEDFERVCAQKHPKMAFLIPTAHNPTVVSLSLARREAIARVAKSYNVLLIEDDLYGHASDDPLPLLAELAPERTIVIGGLSKSVTAGVRGGWLSCPPVYRHRIRVAHKLVTGGMPFLLAEIAARLVLSGQADEIRRQTVAEVNARLDMARSALAGFDFNWCRNVPFIWLSLPDPWLSGTFKKSAYQNGVLIDDEDEFKAGRSEQTVHRVRLGLSQASNPEVAQGLATIRRLLDEGRAGYAGYE